MSNEEDKDIKVKIFYGHVRMEYREVVEDGELLFQHRNTTVHRDGREEVGEWETSGRITNWEKVLRDQASKHMDSMAKSLLIAFSLFGGIMLLKFAGVV